MGNIVNLRVMEAMSQKFGTVDHNTPAYKVLELMIKNQWGEVLVLNSISKETGLVTKDHLTKRATEGIPMDIDIGEICSREIVMVESDAELTSARDIMRGHKIGRLPVLGENGNVVGILTARDVCNGFSGKLEMLGNHMFSVIENIVEAVQVINCNGIVTLWNQQAEKLYGIKASEIIGKDLKDFLPDDLLLKVINNQEDFRYVPEELEDGTLVIKNAVSVFLPDGHMIGAVCTTQDISFYRSLMEQLEKANSKVRTLKRNILSTEKKLKEPFYTINPKTQVVLEQAKKVAETNATILIQGESGTGKELMAYVLFENSHRADKQFIEVNCSAIPETLFESEMFGYEPGAFTGAQKYGKIGKFELAQGGTIFLDEIGELPLEMQAKLLRVLQEKRFYRVGGTIPVNCNVRVVAATNQHLLQLVQEGKFRSDLYYRLNVVNLSIPPLRQRKDDIPGLTIRFLKELSNAYNRQIEGIAEEFLDVLISYSWPGNVRQLHNLLERIVILTDGKVLNKGTLDEVGALGILLGKEEINKNLTTENGSIEVNETLPSNLDVIMEEREREVIIRALEKCRNNKAQTAKLLGIPRSTLYYKIKSLNIIVNA